jgi:serine/threonine protein kinase
MRSACCDKGLKENACSGCTTQIVRNDSDVHLSLAELDARSLIGETIEGYRLLSCLGVGAMGFVYLGQNSFGSKAAIKVLRSSLATQPHLLARFHQEAHALRRRASRRRWGTIW